MDKFIFTGSEYKPHRDFWNQYLDDYRNGFRFGEPPTGQPGRHRRRRSSIDPEAAGNVHRCTGGNDTGTFVCLLTGFCALLRKYGSAGSILLDTPLLNDGAPGPVYADTVTLRLCPDDEAPLKAQLPAVLGAVQAFYTYQHFPLRLLDDSLGSAPFTNVAIVYRPLHGPLADPDRYDLVVELDRDGDGMSLELRYAESLGCESLLENLPGHLAAVLNSLAGPQVPVKALSVLTPAEREQLLYRFNHTEAVFPAETVVGLFERQARLAPAAPALYYQETCLSYGQLDQKAGALALALRDRFGVQPGRVVGLLVNRSHWAIVGMLGVLKAGAAFLPVDPDHPRQRKEAILRDAGVDVLLTDTDLLFELDWYAGNLLALDVEADALTDHLPADLPPVRPSDLAYVLYTSGSSGVPKGCLVEHGNLANYVQWANAYYWHGKDYGNFGLFTSLSFDLTLTSIFCALTRGKHLRIYGQGADPGAVLLDCFSPDSTVEVVKLTPSHITLLDVLITGPTGVKQVIAGGEKLTQKQVEVIHRIGPAIELFNEYGPTETTIGCAAGRVEPGAGPVLIGSPIANTRIFILDAHGGLCPVGVTGEIGVAGAGVTRGYLNREALTAERFVPCPFAGGERMYKTGDLGRWLPGGEIECLGRNDDQLKVNGYRLEPGEIAAVLESHPGVQRAYVNLMDDGEAGPLLFAALVPHPDTAYPVKQLLATARSNPELARQAYRLPNGMTVFSHGNKNEIDTVYEEIFEESMYEKHGIRFAEGDVIFDVGANVGLFSLYASLQAPRVKIFAFEPLAPMYEKLAANAALYKLPALTFNVGLADENKWDTFRYYPNNTAMSSRYGDEAEDKKNVRQVLAFQSQRSHLTINPQEVDQLLDERMQFREVRCQLRRLSDVIREQQVEKIDLLKIDVEKSELDVLRGIDKADWAKIRQVVIEVHDNNLAVSLTEAMLRQEGFRVGIEQDAMLRGTSIYVLYAVREDPSAPVPAPRAEAGPHPLWSDADQLTGEVKHYAESKLPGYLVPTVITCLEEMPLTVNGKADLAAVRSLVRAALQRRKTYAGPEDEAGETLAALWEGVLGVNKISVDENFFDLGGTSLKLIVLLQAITAAFPDRPVSLVDLFKFNTIRMMRTYLQRKSEVNTLGFEV